MRTTEIARETREGKVVSSLVGVSDRLQWSHLAGSSHSSDLFSGLLPPLLRV